MACAANSLVNCMSMARNGCLVSSPSLFGSSKTPYPQTHLSIVTKPIYARLSCSYTSSRSFPSLTLLKKQGPFIRVSFIAALREEKNSAFLDEESFNWGESGNETEGQESDGTVDVLGDAGEEDDEYVEPPEDAKIYVGSLSYDVDSEKLAKLFEQAGVVEIAEVIYNRETDRSRGFGFITMSTVEEGEKAVEMFNGYEWNGKSLIVNKASPKGSRLVRPPRVFARPDRIYVGNLPWSIDDDRLEQVFSEHGKVVSAQVILDRETGRSRGFGFVVMSSESEKNDAIANLDGQNLDGRAIRVNVAQERPRRGAF